MLQKIFIQSDKGDRSTDDVLSWLYYLSPNTKIVNFFDNFKLDDIKIELSNNQKFKLWLDGHSLTQKSIFWYRRGEFAFEKFYNGKKPNVLENQMIAENISPLINFINSSLFDAEINKFQDNTLNKLEMLKHCLPLGIKIPETLVTSHRKDVEALLLKYNSLISKPIRNPFIRTNVDRFKVKFSAPTELITNDNIKSFPLKFLPSLFQQYVPKKYEIRSFYFDDEFYSMAIFSQANLKTQIDFRNYDYERPNRLVPYSLPQKISDKLAQLLRKINLKSGSFDLIVTPKDEYVFLEVNPIGQFQWLMIQPPIDQTTYYES